MHSLAKQFFSDWPNTDKCILDAKVVATIYMQLSVSIQMSIFATRTHSFFWNFNK
jgi:hypothetical protein